MQVFKQILLLSALLIPVMGSAQKLENMKANQWYPISGLNAAKYISTLPGSGDKITDSTKNHFEAYIGEKFKMKDKIAHHQYAYPELTRFCHYDIEEKCVAPSKDEIEMDWRYAKAQAYIKHTGSRPQDVFGTFYLSANMVAFTWDLTKLPGFTPEKAFKGLYRFTEKMQVMHTNDRVHFSNSDKETLTIEVDRKKNHISFTEKGRKFAYSNNHAERKIPRPLEDLGTGVTLAVWLLLDLF